MFAAKVCAEVWFRDPALIPLVALRPCLLVALHLPLRSSLLMAVFLPLLLLSHILLALRLLHLTFILLPLGMPISTLRLLRRTPLVLRSHLAAIPALRFLTSSVVRPSLILPILRLRTFRAVVLVFVLRNSQRGHAQQ